MASKLNANQIELGKFYKPYIVPNRLVQYAQTTLNLVTDFQIDEEVSAYSFVSTRMEKCLITAIRRANAMLQISPQNIEYEVDPIETSEIKFWTRTVYPC